MNSESSTHVQAESGSLIATEHIGTKVLSRDLSASDVLECGPIFSSDQCFVGQPFGNGLLRERRSTHEFAQAIGEGRLALRDFDRSFERGNVRFIHDYEGYSRTTPVVKHHNPGRVLADNVGCTVLCMPASSKPQKIRVREAMRGADGKTFGERVQACMTLRARQLGVPDDDYGQADLIADATRAVGRNPDREDDRVISQQGLSLILNNKVSESHAAIAFALAFGVEAAWLQYGIGTPTALERLLKS